MISEISEISEATNLYRATLEKRLINKFKKDFFEKVGYIPNVISLADDENNLPTIELSDLVKIINELMEEEFGDRMINKKLIRITSILRAREVIDYRYIYYKIGRMMGYSLKQVAYALKTDEGSVYDHTTVMNGIEKFDNLLGNNQKFALQYQRVFRTIRKKILND
jgi:chromosomal replication initiation ATPase DnaA